MRLIPEQAAKLLEPINPARVSKNKQHMSHVEAYEIRAHLNRVFGFCNWSADTLQMENVCAIPIMDEEKGRVGHWLVYRAQVKLTIYSKDGDFLCSYTEWASGKSDNQPSIGDAHDMAMKTAESQALKRCAMNLGDQFGLSLYAKGRLAVIVGRIVSGVFPLTVGTPDTPLGGVDNHIAEPLPAEEDYEGSPESSPEAEVGKPEPRATNRPKVVPRTMEEIAEAAESGPSTGVRPQAYYARLMAEAIGAGIAAGPSPIEDVPLNQFIERAMKNRTGK